MKSRIEKYAEAMASGWTTGATFGQLWQQLYNVVDCPVSKYASELLKSPYLLQVVIARSSSIVILLKH